MIKKENVTIDGKSFVYTYSDTGFYITRDGVIYETAYDPAELAAERIYTETDKLVNPIDDGNE